MAAEDAKVTYGKSRLRLLFPERPYGQKYDPDMDPGAHINENGVIRLLRDEVWQGIGALLAFVALLVPSGVAAWELATGNVRVLLWLQVAQLALPALLCVLAFVVMVALYLIVASRKVRDIDYFDYRPTFRRQARFALHVRLVATVAALLALGLSLVVTVGYTAWLDRTSERTLVLVADFLDPEGQDSRNITRELVTQIAKTLAGFDQIEVRTLGWAIEDKRGEGSTDARRIGELSKASIIVWGDYRVDGEFVAYVHFELMRQTEPLLSTETSRVYGDKKIQDVASTEQALGLPQTYAFNVALGEHLGALAAFAGGLALFDHSAYKQAEQWFYVATRVYGSPLATEIEPAIHYMRGMTHLLTNDPKTAEEELSRTLELLAGDSAMVQYLKPTTALASRGVARGDIGNTAGALSDFYLVIQLDPTDALTYNNRGNIRVLTGDLEGAIADYSKTIELDPTYVGAYNNRGNVRDDLEDFPGALRDLNKAIELDPQFAPAYNNRGIVRSDMGDLPSAFDDYSRAIELDGAYGLAYSNRGTDRALMGDFLGAMSDHNKAVELDPTDASLYGSRGNTRYSMGDLVGAIADYDKSIELDPDLVEAYTNRGVSRQKLGDSAGALSDFDKAIMLGPQDFSARLNRGAIRYEAGDLTGAMSDLDLAVSLNPEHAPAYVNRGVVRRALGDLPGARSDLDKAIALDSQNSSAYTNRGLVLQGTGDVTGAANDFDKAIKLNSEDDTGYSNRGAFRYVTGDLEGAIADLNRAIKLDPHNASAYKFRGLARRDKGDASGAMNDFHRYLVFGREAADRADIMIMIQELQAQLHTRP